MKARDMVLSTPVNWAMSRAVHTIMLVFLLYGCQNQIDQPKSVDHANDRLIEELRELKQTNVDSALGYSSTLRSILVADQDKENLARLLSEIGFMYNSKEQYDSALSYFQAGEIIRAEIGDPETMAYGNIHISSVFIALKQYDSAISHIEKAKVLYTSLTDTSGLYAASNQLGIVYGKLREKDSSKYHFLKAYEYARISKDGSRIETSMNNLGIAYYHEDNYDSAQYFFTKVMQKRAADSNYVGLAGVKDNLANVLLKKGENDKGIELLKEAYHEALDLKHRKYISTSLYSLQKNYKKLNQTDSAYKYLKLYSSHKSRTYKESLAEEIAEAKVKFDTEKIELQKDHAQAQVAKDKRIKFILYIVLAVILLSAILALRNIQQKRRLAEKENELHKERIDNMLRDHEMKTFEAMVEVQEGERKRIAEDLHDRLGSILSAVKLHFAAVEEKMQALRDETATQYEKAYELLDLAAQEVRSISHDMLSNVLVKFGLLPALHDLQDTLESSGQIKIEIFDHGMENRLDNKVEITIYRVIQELISNILKHAQASKIEIELTMSEGHLNIIVSDDGKGFDVTKNLSAGVGLQNIEKRLYSINGKMMIDSQINKGTSTIIDIELENDHD